ncbi:response regulator [Methylobacterium dankookense]|uniref:Chemotaxis response regulator protein-glutamate methylesterase n=1 Tax=Methylobacterium dankookense TaxID=560405 RepID=A0A564FRS5_9HYPH|nr:response regulator [Methylobacterium dankookense]GJD58564.1 Protein-glutamate methylesterase/protein-glutamine glutaminase [Methylobacterium dankookense]VUF10893.1 Chemotaxis response regulator protein-glutamate methylesterase [Methylobacterium dankookense]
METGLTVLVADADEETRLDLVEAIAASDPSARIIEACNGRELAAALAGEGVDLVFVDVILPGTDAGSLLAWRERRGRGAMIVLLSDLLAPRWPAVARLVGAYDVLLKPLNERHVARVLAASGVIRRELRLLVVEPRAATRNLIRRLLRDSHFSFEIVDAERGGVALRAARLGSFDVAMIEAELPDLPALEVACQVSDRHRHAKILLMGFSNAAIPARQLDTFGACAYLRKPFSFADIDRTIHDAFGLWHPYLVKALQAEEAGTLALGA